MKQILYFLILITLVLSCTSTPVQKVEMKAFSAAQEARQHWQTDTLDEEEEPFEEFIDSDNL